MSNTSYSTACPTWTGGQFSALRALVGLVLAAYFLLQVPALEEALATSPAATSNAELEIPFQTFDRPLSTPLLALGTALALLLAAGFRTRLLACVLAFFLWMESGASLFPYFAALLAYIGLQSPAPYGSFDARGRVDPGGGWRLRRSTWRALWVVYFLGAVLQNLAYFDEGSRSFQLEAVRWLEGSGLRIWFDSPGSRTSGFHDWLLACPMIAWQIVNWLLLAVAIASVPFALFRRTRLYAWSGLLLLHLVSFVASDHTQMSVVHLLFMFAMFDPGWLPAKRSDRPLWIFYDGECGLCHRMVRLVLAEDTSGRGFRFAPLQSPVFEARVPASERAQLPDSLAVLDESGSLTTRATAVIQILEGLGGLWRLAALLLRLLPRPLADFGYACIARVRKWLFAKPEGACPMIPPALAGRFEFDAAK